MSIESRTRMLLRADAMMSWIAALPGFLAPSDVATFFGAEDPAYSFVVRVWSGFLFVFGCVSWDTSGDVRGRTRLLKYIWLQRAVAAFGITIGHLAGEAPPSLMGLNVVTNIVWIAPLLYFSYSLRQAR